MARHDGIPTWNLKCKIGRQTASTPRRRRCVQDFVAGGLGAILFCSLAGALLLDLPTPVIASGKTAAVTQETLFPTEKSPNKAAERKEAKTKERKLQRASEPKQATDLKKATEQKQAEKRKRRVEQEQPERVKHAAEHGKAGTRNLRETRVGSRPRNIKLDMIQPPVMGRPTKQRTLADLTLIPEYSQFGKLQPAAYELQEMGCKYTIYKDNQRHPLVVAGSGTQAVLRADRAAKAIVNAGETLRFAVEPGSMGVKCLESEDLDVRVGESSEIRLRVRSPRPWLLAVLTSVDFPDREDLSENEQNQERWDFWRKTLETMDAAIRELGRGGQPGLRFARIVEGSAAGKATREISGASADAPLSLDVLPVNGDRRNQLVMTPAYDQPTAGRGGIAPDDLVGAIRDFADGQSLPATGIQNTLLIVQGFKSTLHGQVCEEFQSLVKGLDRPELRVVKLVPARRIDPAALAPPVAATRTGSAGASPPVGSASAGALPPASADPATRDSPSAPAARQSQRPAPSPTAPTLEPYSADYGHEGVYVCNPDRYATGNSRLLVFEYPKQFGDGARETPLRVIKDVLSQPAQGDQVRRSQWD